MLLSQSTQSSFVPSNHLAQLPTFDLVTKLVSTDISFLLRKECSESLRVFSPLCWWCFLNNNHLLDTNNSSDSLWNLSIFFTEFNIEWDD